MKELREPPLGWLADMQELEQQQRRRSEGAGVSQLSLTCHTLLHPSRCRSTGISLYYQMEEEALAGFSGERHGNDFLVNLIDSPGAVGVRWGCGVCEGRWV